MPASNKQFSKRIKTMAEAQEYVKRFAKDCYKNTKDTRWLDYPNIDKFDHLHEELIEMSRKIRYHSRVDCERIVRKNKDLFVDGIGDLFFALCRLANQLDIDIEHAFNIVHKKIYTRYSNRKNKS